MGRRRHAGRRVRAIGAPTASGGRRPLRVHVVFSFADAAFEIPEVFVEVSRRTWIQVASPGTWWSGPERVAIAEAARAARIRKRTSADELPKAAVDVATMIGATPGYTTATWVGDMIDVLGELRYVEAASIASRVVSIDTFTRLVGSGLEAFPQPGSGKPSQRHSDPAPRRSRAWIEMVGFASPPNAFSAVPEEAAAMNDITDNFYMPEFDMQYPDYSRMGLHRTQIETVAGVTSHANECFF